MSSYIFVLIAALYLATLMWLLSARSNLKRIKKINSLEIQLENNRDSYSSIEKTIKQMTISGLYKLEQHLGDKLIFSDSANLWDFGHFYMIKKGEEDTTSLVVSSRYPLFSDIFGRKQTKIERLKANISLYK